MMMIETPRMILREFCNGDADALAAVLSDPGTMRFYPAPLDRAGVEEWMARNRRRYAKDGHGLWAMVVRQNNEVIGDCGWTVQNVDGTDEMEIGYHVRRELWGRGLATEAARACREYGFARLPVERLISIIPPENLPSRRVAEKNGMTIWKQEMRVGFPHLIYSIRRDQWENLRATGKQNTAV
jgi:[ribosomal protein S5]-alanine N-acetyltransferase